MIVRYLTRSDVAEHDKITSQAFSYSCDVGDPDSVLPCEKVLGAFDDDNKTLLADMEINDRKCRYDGGILTCAAIGGVAAKPEHRGKGAVRELFQRVFTSGGYDISILYPFSEEYYRRLGYERVGLCHSVTVPFAGIAKIRRNTDVVLYEGKDTGLLLDIYNRCAGKNDLSFVREDASAYSDKPYLSQKFTYIWKENAYATFSVDREKSMVFVREIYFDSYSSMLGILGFLRNYESNQTKLCFLKLPESTPLFNVIRELKSCEIKTSVLGAARVLDTEKVLRTHKYPAREGAFTIRVGDETIRTTVSENGVTTEKSGAYEPEVIMDVSTASKVLLTGLRDAAYEPGITVKDPRSAFFGLFPPRSCFFSDEF